MKEKSDISKDEMNVIGGELSATVVKEEARRRERSEKHVSTNEEIELLKSVNLFLFLYCFLIFGCCITITI
jgi:hypothetical protein